MVEAIGVLASERSETADTELEARFAAFVGTHREKARRLAFRLVGGDEAAAEDVVQDALVRAFGALSGFRHEARLSTWFYRILVRQAHSYRRWRKVRQSLGGLRPASEPSELEPPDPSAAPPGDPVLRQRIALALDSLSRPQREAFVLVHLEGFTVRESAELMGKAEGTVKSHLHRALRALRDELAELAPGREETG